MRLSSWESRHFHSSKKNKFPRLFKFLPLSSAGFRWSNISISAWWKEQKRYSRVVKVSPPSNELATRSAGHQTASSSEALPRISGHPSITQKETISQFNFMQSKEYNASSMRLQTYLVVLGLSIVVVVVGISQTSNRTPRLQKRFLSGDGWERRVCGTLNGLRRGVVRLIANQMCFRRKAVSTLKSQVTCSTLLEDLIDKILGLSMHSVGLSLGLLEYVLDNTHEFDLLPSTKCNIIWE